MGVELVTDTMGGLFWHRVMQSPATVGFRYERQDFTNAEIGALAGRFRAALKREGAESGMRIAAFMYNSPHLLALFMACAMEGLVFCPINVALRRGDLAYTLGDIEPFAAFIDGELSDVFGPASAGLSISRVFVSGEAKVDIPKAIDVNGWLGPANDAGPFPTVGPSDPLCIIYSGGTTGLPKGIVIPQFGPVAAALRFDLIAAFSQQESYFSVLQISHAFTPLIALPFCLTYGYTFCFWKWWSASRFVDLIAHYGATITDAFIGMIATLLRTEPRDIDSVMNKTRVIAGLGGQDPVAQRLRSQFEERFGSRTFDLYGFAESNGLISFERESIAFKAGSCGTPCDWFDVIVAGPNDFPLAPGVTGEVLVRPRVPYTVGLGYHNKSDNTVRTWRNLWIHTGDLAYFDEAGYLFYVGRRNHFLRRRGELISAAEIESAIMNYPGIVEAAVVAAESEFGEDEVRACVVSTAQDFEPKALIDFLRGEVAPFKVPRYIDVLDALPRSGAKREIEKFRLQERDLALAWDSAPPTGSHLSKMSVTTK